MECNRVWAGVEKKCGVSELRCLEGQSYVGGPSTLTGSQKAGKVSKQYMVIRPTSSRMYTNGNTFIVETVHINWCKLHDIVSYTACM